MKFADKLIIAAMIAAVLILCVAIIGTNTDTEKCEQLGGVYQNGLCFEPRCIIDIGVAR